MYISSPELTHLVRESVPCHQHLPFSSPSAPGEQFYCSTFCFCEFNFFLFRVHLWVRLYSVCLLEILLIVLRTWRFWIFFFRKGSNFSGDKWGGVLDFGSMGAPPPGSPPCPLHLLILWLPLGTLSHPKCQSQSPQSGSALWGREESTAVTKRSEDNHKVGQVTSKFFPSKGSQSSILTKVILQGYLWGSLVTRWPKPSLCLQTCLLMNTSSSWMVSGRSCLNVLGTRFCPTCCAW